MVGHWLIMSAMSWWSLSSSRMTAGLVGGVELKDDQKHRTKVWAVNWSLETLSPSTCV
ncbi:hypothetical protein PHLCEN_2v4638 [Hermanssonia centrifuga]|uniref:Uncharacterized protein n=1 Tax=Hermanssonia centrifuga TaxID=98765 RepID=A0A2R6PMX4_9APHY|nr:hypothetical protein PHLCEN_2v4638 [Hermanssonia centrifuga]